jgi:hypothetical protein
VFLGWIFSLNWRELGAWGSVFLAGLGGFVGAGLAGFNGGNRFFFLLEEEEEKRGTM